MWEGKIEKENSSRGHPSGCCPSLLEATLSPGFSRTEDDSQAGAMGDPKCPVSRGCPPCRPSSPHPRSSSSSSVPAREEGCPGSVSHWGQEVPKSTSATQKRMSSTHRTVEGTRSRAYGTGLQQEALPRVSLASLGMHGLRQKSKAHLTRDEDVTLPRYLWRMGAQYSAGKSKEARLETAGGQGAVGAGPLSNPYGAHPSQASATPS